ncbi:MAG: hypothetical protein KDC38_16200, partial [Planctomycetes bacterium]|nr:hypothetical protein [Planctomycetota bacterium]
RTDLVPRRRRPGASMSSLVLAIALTLVGVGAATADEKKDIDPSDIKKLVKQSFFAQDHAGLREILLRCARMNATEPTQALLEQAQKFGQAADGEDWYWGILQGVGSFNRPLAMTAIGDYVVNQRRQPISRDLLQSLQNNRSKYVNRVIRRVLDLGTHDMKLLALDMAAQLQYRRTVDILIPFYEGLENDKGIQAEELRQRVVLALEALTLQRMGNSLINWKGWWANARYKGLKTIREEAQDAGRATGLARPIDPIRERQFLGLEQMPEGKVLVVEGPVARNGVNTNNDDIAAKLSTLKIPHDTVLKERLEDSDYSIDRYAAIFINCTQIHKFCQSPGHSAGEAVGNRLRRCLGPNPHDEVQFKMKQPALDKLEKWVARGGYLFTEDWVMAEAVAPTWPKLVQVGEKLEENHVEIRPATGKATHKFLRGVFVTPPKIEDFHWDEEEEDPYGLNADDEKDKDKYDPTVEDDEEDTSSSGGGKTGVAPKPESEEEESFDDPDIDTVKHEWKIDNESNAISVRSRKVETLIVSNDLRKICDQPAVAITFDHGQGKVLHVLSHFGKQSSSHNEATIENLLINFLIEVKVRVDGSS